jgi:hypothetical protein
MKSFAGSRGGFSKEPLAAGGKKMRNKKNSVIEPGMEEEPPPILKSWKNFYLLVLGNLILWIILFTIFTWMFK